MTAFFFVSTSLCCPFFWDSKSVSVRGLRKGEKIEKVRFLGHFENIDPTRSNVVDRLGIIVKL